MLEVILGKEVNMNFKESILVLYDLGISLSALSKMYKEADEDQVCRVLNGDYLEIQFKYGLFNDKDVALLSSSESIEKSKLYISNLLADYTQKKIEYFFYYEKGYPESLKNIPSPPFIIFTKGDINLLESKFICSIVGTRNPTNQTLNQIRNTVKELVSKDVVIASGLALGTDIYAHKCTLEEEGRTIAVLPTPIDNVTPKSHIVYAHEIVIKKGLLISEYYKNESLFKKSNFVNRNRLISGLSNAVIIAECSEKSGTMHTARFAFKQNRPLYCFDNTSSGVQKILYSNSARIYNNVNDLLL